MNAYTCPNCGNDAPNSKPCPRCEGVGGQVVPIWTAQSPSKWPSGVDVTTLPEPWAGRYISEMQRREDFARDARE